MTKIRFETGQVIDFDGTPTRQDIDEVAQQLNIKPVSPVTEEAPKRTSILPLVGQIAGGIAGGVAGATVGRPFVGAGVGGVLGRTGAREFERQTEELIEKPIRTIFETAKEPVFSPIRSILRRTPEEREELGREIGITAGTEAVFAPVGIGFSKIIGVVGKGISGGLLGRRVTQRGIERGWKALLDPKLYQNRISKETAVKTNKFFTKVSNVTGKRVSDLVNTKYKNVKLNMIDIKNRVRALLPKSGKPEDLLERFAPKSQRELVKGLTDDILEAGDTKSISELWKFRKDELDKAIFGKSWTEDALTYLKGLRRAINDPIRNVGDDVASAFDNYAFVKNAEEELAKKFTAIQNKATGEIFAPDLEKFITSLLSESKDETIRLLRSMDAFLDVSDRVIEQALDAAAAESLEKGVGITLVGRIIAGLFGGRKILPRIGREVQRPVTQAVKTGLGRLLPSLTREGIATQ
ncbi:hypothetical protein LCGC14_0435100 [marine sediment metagenome]|uniref:Uncharacterized protein n=1 Tax=marine sediment metagenome TaxID=412755 RepID=A0A0F9VWC9_9ZZZZ